MNIESGVALVVAAVLLGYLIVAMLHPEKF